MKKHTSALITVIIVTSYCITVGSWSSLSISAPLKLLQVCIRPRFLETFPITRRSRARSRMLIVRVGGLALARTAPVITLISPHMASLWAALNISQVLSPDEWNPIFLRLE
ncbi:hypothetical protein BDV10DRAFT_169613 [Aspergillus recurvatus]